MNKKVIIGTIVGLIAVIVLTIMNNDQSQVVAKSENQLTGTQSPQAVSEVETVADQELIINKSVTEEPVAQTATVNTKASEVVPEKKPTTKVQVFLFHSTQRCSTCIAIGRLAGETIYEYYQPELRDGKIEFREVNIDLPENKALAQKFQASGSALFINKIINGQDDINEDTTVWRLTSNPDQFKSYLKNKINNLIGK
ncbi:hypothetical protein COT94_03965 [Candidatus Falkowbacteria bacterium CG10_big_fil_rev_8_21_14_0_10_37_14]|uniref:Thioredoxin domain-containing protein n=1 Tax=Candidatus Falkowbacteria bacterium CG10_big_fil_rev_8_21_14_0_10_37_14 TaxID=1974561 RepID=A0A2M6WSI6_9BACT|nr:hypothetical protein [Candidatus Falkowbacteria bacterium]PIT95715.1 MAG: hypothetical protein COT94_03965 [Candidatus Falkowbacteria bacterium CG10_big_fil_rev_8_21_14_0_10_37_14]